MRLPEFFRHVFGVWKREEVERPTHAFLRGFPTRNLPVEKVNLHLLVDDIQNFGHCVTMRDIHECSPEELARSGGYLFATNAPLSELLGELKVRSGMPYLDSGFAEYADSKPNFNTGPDAPEITAVRILEAMRHAGHARTPEKNFIALSCFVSLSEHCHGEHGFSSIRREVDLGDIAEWEIAAGYGRSDHSCLDGHKTKGRPLQKLSLAELLKDTKAFAEVVLANQNKIKHPTHTFESDASLTAMLDELFFNRKLRDPETFASGKPAECKVVQDAQRIMASVRSAEDYFDLCRYVRGANSITVFTGPDCGIMKKFLSMEAAAGYAPKRGMNSRSASAPNYSK